jgi:CBS domain-containing protein
MSLSVRDVMTPDPVTASPDTPVTDIVDAIIEKRFSGLPVVENGEVVGLVEVGDLLPRPSNVPFSDVEVLEFQDEWIEEDDLENFYEAIEGLTAERVMRTDELPIIAPDVPLTEILHQIVEEGPRRFLVVDEEEGLVGVVTRKDLLDVFYRWP